MLVKGYARSEPVEDPFDQRRPELVEELRR
jgi:hypothetical protein